MAKPSDAHWYSDVEDPIIVDDAESAQWDEEVDVAVVGFGGAGACAAMEASENGAKVMVIDRFMGGGATAISGGVVYAGGGTSHQKSAGVDDTPEEMYKYLSMETKGVVEDSTLKKLCNESVENLQWLEQKGVQFEGSLCPHKTSYPINKYCLYYSGNEGIGEYSKRAKPAPRGHVPREKKGRKSFPGSSFFGPLEKATIRQGVLPRLQSNVRRLITNKEGAVVGLEFLEIAPNSIWRRLHRVLAFVATSVHKYSPGFSVRFRRWLTQIEKKRARSKRLRARRGVILSAGGFVMNPKMLTHYAPKYAKGGLPLGSPGDDGSGIRLGESVGAAAGRMDRVSAWRFINPPMAWAQGIVVNTQGERFCNESVYGALLGERMCEDHGSKGFLVIDKTLFRRALRQLAPWKVMCFQLLPAALSMFFDARKARTLEEVARICKIPGEKLLATVDAYNAMATGNTPDPFGKSKDFLQPLREPPYYAMDVSLGAKLFVCAKLTFGGLVLDEKTGGVNREDGSVIPGLYAAGRTAVGIASNSYVSGLSIADCVFSGRRAGRHAATGSQ
jgi:3-oxo-5alpha-steroid 4-dehydrogenase